MAEEQRVIAVNGCGEERGDAPEQRSGNDERAAWEAVAEPSGERGRDHVGEEEGRGEQAHLRVVGVEFFLHERLDAGKT